MDSPQCVKPASFRGLQVPGQVAIDDHMPLPAPDSARFIGNVMFVPSGDTMGTWPAHNDATAVPLIFADPTNGNYDLVSPTELTPTTEISPELI